jgi:hypothetical protein
MDNTTWFTAGAFVAGVAFPYLISYVASFFPDDFRLRLKNATVMLKLAWVAMRSDGRSFPLTVTTIMREESDALLMKRIVPNEQASTEVPAQTTH